MLVICLSELLLSICWQKSIAIILLFLLFFWAQLSYQVRLNAGIKAYNSYEWIKVGFVPNYFRRVCAIYLIRH